LPSDHDGNLPRLEPGRAHIELADREGVDDGDRVTRNRSLDDPGRRLGHHQQLTEAALRLRVLTDDAQPARAAVDQPDRHRCHPAPDRERVTAPRAVTDDLAHELVPHHDVAVGVVQRSPRRVVDRELWMIHEMDVGSADRGAERLQQQITLSGNRIGGIADLEPPTSQHHCAQSFFISRLFEILFSTF